MHKDLSRVASEGNLPLKEAILKKKLEQLQILIKEKISDFKLRKRKKLRCKLLKSDPTRRKFWRFLQHQIKAVGNITSLLKDREMVFEQNQIEETLMDHFGGVFAGSKAPPFVAHSDKEDIQTTSEPTHNSLRFENDVCSSFSMTELSEILKSLPTGKASGHDCIPNELLKNTDEKFQMYLQTFLNKIMDEGEVPESLNIGKCMLIYKVHTPT